MKFLFETLHIHYLYFAVGFVLACYLIHKGNWWYTGVEARIIYMVFITVFWVPVVIVFLISKNKK